MFDNWICSYFPLHFVSTSFIGQQLTALMFFLITVLLFPQASPYSSGGYSLLKTLALTVGDLDTDSFFGFDIRGQAHDTSHVQYMGLSTFFWILSLIFMTILLSNLMVCAYVHKLCHFKCIFIYLDWSGSWRYSNNYQ